MLHCSFRDDLAARVAQLTVSSSLLVYSGSVIRPSMFCKPSIVSVALQTFERAQPVTMLACF
jgi:hypothetical protein